MQASELSTAISHLQKTIASAQKCLASSPGEKPASEPSCDTISQTLQECQAMVSQLNSDVQHAMQLPLLRQQVDLVKEVSRAFDEASFDLQQKAISHKLAAYHESLTVYADLGMLQHMLGLMLRKAAAISRERGKLFVRLYDLGGSVLIELKIRELTAVPARHAIIGGSNVETSMLTRMALMHRGKFWLTHRAAKQVVLFLHLPKHNSATQLSAREAFQAATYDVQ